VNVSVSVRSGSRRNRHAMRKCIERIACALVAAGAVAAPAPADELSSKTAPMSRGWEFAERGGADLFNSVCAACHQANAKGAIGAAADPSLAGNTKLASTDFVLAVLLGGLRGMPPVGDMMSDEQVADVANYVRTHFGNSYGPVSAAEVATARRRKPAP
jgi:mono/diheme cytochrome c family protein